jgi:hypothetical protein
VPTSMENLIFDYFCNFEMLPIRENLPTITAT